VALGLPIEASGGSQMRLKHYFLVIAVGYTPVPVLPLTAILLVGETLLGFQLEDHKVPKFLSSIFKPAKGH
jgi:hypothetical protein